MIQTVDLRRDDLHLFTPDGREFLNLPETARQHQGQLKVAEKRVEAEKKLTEAATKRAEAAEKRAEVEKKLTEAATKRAEAADKRAEAEKRRAEHLAARLRALGIDIGD